VSRVVGMAISLAEFVLEERTRILRITHSLSFEIEVSRGS
jgi:hypothetical protein